MAAPGAGGEVGEEGGTRGGAERGAEGWGGARGRGAEGLERGQTTTKTTRTLVRLEGLEQQSADDLTRFGDACNLHASPNLV